jgi:hypothetical protein
VNLKGAYTPDEVHRRLRRVRRELKRKEQDPEEKTPMKELRQERENISTLISSDFGGRVAGEVRWRPNGMVALTVEHGRKQAKTILLRRARERQGRLRRVEGRGYRGI